MYDLRLMLILVSLFEMWKGGGGKVDANQQQINIDHIKFKI